MIEIKEILYRWRKGHSVRGIAKSLGLARNTARELINQASSLGLTRSSDDHELGAIALKLVEAKHSQSKGSGKAQKRIANYHDQIKEWWDMPNMTVTQMLRLLSEQYGATGSESSLHRYLKQHFKPKTKTTVVLPTIPGGQAQVDFGYVDKMFDPKTSKHRKTYAFVMTLSHSRLRFVRFVFSQDVQTWIHCHIKAFLFFGGVPKNIMLDNLKAGVVKADIYDPTLNRSYADFEQHYGFVADPNKARTPEHKGKVERSITIVRQQVIAGRDHKDIHAANAYALKWAKEEIAHRVTRTTGETPWARYIRDEKPALLPLPQEDFECSHWADALVHRDQHVVYKGSFYSVPHQYVGEKVWLKVTATAVQIFHQEKSIKLHPRAQQKGQWVTDKQDYPLSAKCFLEKTPDACRASAKAIGVATGQLISSLLTRPSNCKLRKAQGILRLAEKFGCTRLEAACQRALDFGNEDYKSILRILEKGLDKEHIISTEPKPSLRGAYLRAPTEFTTEEILH